MAPSPLYSTNSTAPPAAGDVRWTVADLIDFDYYVDEDERALREKPGLRKQLAERDRALYLGGIKDATAGQKEHTPKHRSAALRLWLEARRGIEDPQLRGLLPGETFARGQRLVILGLGAVGLLAGIGMASALLSYDGQRPVNVGWFISLLVLLQLFLAGFTAAVWLARSSGPMRSVMEDFSLLSRIIAPLFAQAARWVQRTRLGHVSREVRDKAGAKQGLFRSHHALYGSASYLPLLIPAQVFGVAFNVGAILATVSLEWFTDLAFGWGSSLHVDPRTIYEIARLIALPWSPFFGEGVGYPSLDQIAGSRIVLKDPLFILHAEDLRSWGLFLILSLVTYGLLPRLALLGASVWAQRRALASLPFTHARTQGLYARLVTPSLETAQTGSGVGPEMAIPAAPSVASVPAAPSVAEPAATGGGIPLDACLLMIHVDVDEVLEAADRERLERLLRQHTGWRVAVSCIFGGSSVMTNRAIETVEGARWQSPPPRVVLIEDGTQPPITESLGFLRKLRAAVGTQGQIVLMLVGDADAEDRLRPLSDFDFLDWQRKIDQMGDPYLRLEMLAPSANGVR
ncbi:DUF2868 domain-containing protein [Thiococcus pfennigii]|uniref:DUF2868 domain-containing protein n=1 Tax=Thiococcus pfennigii TaxID=1057 RepID=UPI001906E78E|nr:DUF2868 domain-containing protein [Thiococcus pfennigii]MBK1701151.1 cell division protein [Thiococcus pfennigii]MBK1732855.1 cell division protein [Thiococcus pfennigii]